uniref:Uncharacterized protein n=1 Tax=Anguilla anguilla TaxID=7936 RepID=A0A0E9XFJ4_ANGAN
MQPLYITTVLYKHGQPGAAMLSSGSCGPQILEGFASAIHYTT